MKLQWKFVSIASLLCVASAADASDHGCKVLLCLANPNGPRAVSECRPPIDKLFRDLARGRSFPTCDLASAPGQNGGRSWAQPTMNMYDPCPEGTTALASGFYAIQGAAVPTRPGANTAVYVGIGEGQGGWTEDYQYPQKTCVGSRLGTTRVYVNNGQDGGTSRELATVYDRVFQLDNARSLRAIDVYVDSQLYRRVRW